MMRPRYDMVQCYPIRLTPAGWEVLQLRRVPKDFMGGTWQVVYGGIQEGEKAWQTALRELREETSLTPLEFYQLDTVNIFYLAADDCLWHCPGFVAVIDPLATVQLDAEHDDHRWLSVHEFEKNILWPGERRALEAIRGQILEGGPAKKYLRLPLPGPTRP